MKFLLRRHMPFYIATGGGVIAFLFGWFFDRAIAPALGANCFFILYLLAALYTLPHLTVAHLKRHSGSTDEPVWIIFLVTFSTVIAAIASLFILINQKDQPELFSLITILAAVPLGWLTIHMLTAMHYAHIYWQTVSTSDSNNQYRGGFEFPGTPEPTGSDFVYYSYVSGMTSQTSDTNVTTSAMRRITLKHSIISFFFNTVLVAAAVNVVVALGS